MAFVPVTESELRAALGLGRGGKRGELRGPCPISSSKPDSTALQITATPGGGWRVHCFGGCEKRDVYAAVEARVGRRLNPLDDGFPSKSAPFRQNPPLHKPHSGGFSGGAGGDHHPPPENPVTAAARAAAGGIWNAARPIPADENHPARRWAAARSLWRPGLPFPAALRWYPVHSGYWPSGGEGFAGAGCIVAAAAPAGEWAGAWPDIPPPTGVQMLAITAAGAGADKRSRGILRGALVMVGNPAPPDGAALRVVEGVADALAVAARERGPVAAVLGATPPDGLADWPGLVVVHADKDGAGILRLGIPLQTAIRRRGGRCKILYHRGGAKDAADAAAAAGFPPYDAGVARDCADTYRAMHGDWPAYEVGRLAILDAEDDSDDFV